jgi:hypothetical protein
MSTEHTAIQAAKSVKSSPTANAMNYSKALPVNFSVSAAAATTHFENLENTWRNSWRERVLSRNMMNSQEEEGKRLGLYRWEWLFRMYLNRGPSTQPTRLLSSALNYPNKGVILSSLAATAVSHTYSISTQTPFKPQGSEILEKRIKAK